MTEAWTYRLPEADLLDAYSYTLSIRSPQGFIFEVSTRAWGVVVWINGGKYKMFLADGLFSLTECGHRFTAEHDRASHIITLKVEEVNPPVIKATAVFSEVEKMRAEIMEANSGITAHTLGYHEIPKVANKRLLLC